jgi:hypothetical protein
MAQDGLRYEDDVRHEDPGVDRQRAFKRGWTEAVKSTDASAKYSDEPDLERLTWENLGWRLGTLFGETSDELRQRLFEWCVDQQAESP